MGRLPDTAPLALRTGLPGSGKTLKTVQEMQSYIAEGRPVFASNFVGLNLPGVIDFPDPREWQTLPPDSLLYVDEAQAFFPPKGGNEKPQHIAAFSTVRHAGICVVLITQAPSLLHKHIREVAGCHEHLLREEGKPKSHVFRWSEVQDNPKSRSAKLRADGETFHHPAECFGLYKSAETHNIKVRWQTRRIRAYALAAIGLLVFAGVMLSVFTGADDYAKAPAGSSQASPGTPGAPAESSAYGILPQSADEPPMSALEYATLRIPRVPEQPWSAPLYDGRPVVSDPRVFCLSTENTCRCITEQGTPYNLRDQSCRYVARWGEPYNPYKQPDQQTTAAAQPSALADGGAAAPVATL